MDDEQQSQPQPAPRPLDAEHEQRRPRRTRRLVVAGIATTALVAGVGGVGAGYALGHGFGSSGSSTSASGTQRSTTSNGQGSAGGLVPIPGNGSWSWSGGESQGGSGGSMQPFGGYGSGGAGGYGGSGGTTGGQSNDRTTTASGSQLTGLVRIVTNMKYAGAKAAGTGMILTSDGEVITNHHVVAGATSVKVRVMSTGKTYVAKVVGTDTKDDVAVLQLTGASGLSTVSTDTSAASVGEAVTAVGDAGGTTNHLSAASGKVLALSQSITTQDEGTATGERLTGLIKISSDVISGDSGGATYDSSGKVIGMTTAASSGTADVVGYAVPIAKVLKIAGQLESGTANSRYDYGSPAFLGVGLGQTGTTVVGVYPGTPAAKAGIVAGDTITAVGSTKVTSADQVHAAVAGLSPGDSVSVTWTGTAGASHTETVTLTTGPVE